MGGVLGERAFLPSFLRRLESHRPYHVPDARGGQLLQMFCSTCWQRLTMVGDHLTCVDPSWSEAPWRGRGNVFDNHRR